MQIQNIVEDRFKELIESLPNVAVQGYNSNREVIFWNEASENLYGYTKEEAYGKKLEDLIIPEENKQKVVETIDNWLQYGAEIQPGELSLRKKDGSRVVVLSSHVMLYLSSNNPQFFCVDVDITQQHHTENKLKSLVIHDSLTGLVNRPYMESEIESLIKNKTPFGLMFIDLDHFKDVNDTMGHDAGDELLLIVTQRISAILRTDQEFARFGGDEFVLLLPDVVDQQALDSIANRILDVFSNPFVVNNQELYVTASIGICMCPQDGSSVKDLFKNADTAMYSAKEAGRNRFRHFSNKMNLILQSHQQMINGLHHAVENNNFYMVYQPQVDLRTGIIKSCEALIRWEPNSNHIGFSPAQFIPIAERSGLILKIGDWVAHHVCQQMVRWREQQLDIQRVDINLSGKQLAQPGFLERFLSILDEYGLKPTDVGIELTEHVLIFAKESIIRRLKDAQLAGTHVSIDDFGTGYSSLSYLKKFPIQTLKIDQSFIREAPKDSKDAAILRAIIQVGQSLNLTTVVEGIETEVQKIFCQALGCDLGQGFYFFKPLPEKEFSALLKRQMELNKSLINV